MTPKLIYDLMKYMGYDEKRNIQLYGIPIQDYSNYKEEYEYYLADQGSFKNIHKDINKIKII